MNDEMTPAEIRHLREELDHLQDSGHITPELRVVRDQLIALEEKQTRKALAPVAATQANGETSDAVAEGAR